MSNLRTLNQISLQSVLRPAVGDPVDSWYTQLTRLLEKYFVVFCLGFIGIACARIISTYNTLSLTIDEPSHLACGTEYIANHVYRIETQHPPLSRMMIALGPYMAGVRPLGLPLMGKEGVGEIASSGNVDRTIFLMRSGTLPFFILACVVAGAWSCHYFGKPVAVVATALFTLLPTTLADAGLAITDMALGATVGAAFLVAMLWAEKPTLLRSLLLGVSLALACLSKFTALGYLPMTLGLALVAYLAAKWPGWDRLGGMARRRILPLALAAVTTGFVIWAGYWFSFAPFDTNLRVGHLSLPAPEFFDGARSALHHNRTGHMAFLLGRVSMTGWWYYFPVALAVKTPISFLILLGIGMFACLRGRRQPAYFLLLAFVLGILLPAMSAPR